MSNQFQAGDIVVRKGRQMRVLRVGMSEDNHGKLREAVWCADVDELVREEAGEMDNTWGYERPFKASVYPYLFSEVQRA